jgi:hypothetical protein
MGGPVNLAGLAEECKALAERAEAGLAEECARAAAREFRAALDITVPVLTGDLRDSMRTFSVSGGGAVAVAEVGSELIYAKFRNDGGTITAHGPWPLRNKDTGQVFSRPGGSVTQAGSRYMERAEEWAESPIAATCQIKLDEYLKL